jgi:hypothetical protein
MAPRGVLSPATRLIAEVDVSILIAEVDVSILIGIQWHLNRISPTWPFFFSSFFFFLINLIEISVLPFYFLMAAGWKKTNLLTTLAHTQTRKSTGSRSNHHLKKKIGIKKKN